MNKTSLLISALSLFLVAGCGLGQEPDAQPEPTLTAWLPLPSGPVKAMDPNTELIADRWGECFEGLTVYSLERRDKVTYVYDSELYGLLKWQILESDTGTVLTIPDEHTTKYAELSGCLD